MEETLTISVNDKLMQTMVDLALSRGIIKKQQVWVIHEEGIGVVYVASTSKKSDEWLNEYPSYDGQRMTVTNMEID